MASIRRHILPNLVAGSIRKLCHWSALSENRRAAEATSDTGEPSRPIPIGSRTTRELAAAKLTGPWNGFRVDVRLGAQLREVGRGRPAGDQELVVFQIPAGPGLGLQIDPAHMREHTPKGEDWA